jgi:outer membrane protein assembly factor BamE (lipoprotein component of BamABCDE complex)
LELLTSENRSDIHRISNTQMKITNIFIAVAISLISIGFTGCNNTPDKLGTLDLKTWRTDRGACKNERTELVNSFKAEQHQLMGKFIDDIGKLLGRPDIHQLGERNLKYYVYFLEKGSQCQNGGEKSTASKVILRFNAVGLLSEITYQDRILD